jgi:Domain of unknown function DUF29
LRRLAESRPNEAIDVPHLAEELEDLGKEQRNAVRSWTARLIEHLLLLAYSPASEPRRGWTKEVLILRREIMGRLSPALRLDLAGSLPRLYAGVRHDLEIELARFGEADVAAALPSGCPFKLDQLLDTDWWPAPGSGKTQR